MWIHFSSYLGVTFHISPPLAHCYTWVPLLFHNYSASTAPLQLTLNFMTTLFPILEVIYPLFLRIFSLLFPAVAFIAHLNVLFFSLVEYMSRGWRTRRNKNKTIETTKLTKKYSPLSSSCQDEVQWEVWLGFFQEVSTHHWNPGHQVLKQDLLLSKTVS